MPQRQEPKVERRVYVRRIYEEVDPKQLSEKKAQIDKARARVDVLRKELAEKRQQLVDAERDLAKLSAATRALNLSLTTPRITLSEVPGKPGGTTIVKRVAPGTLEYHFAGPGSSLSPSDRERLESLEKKLAKLLDEVASLKKRDEKAK